MIEKNEIQVYPSLLSADFGHLAKEVERMEREGADGIHVDVMDGHFVPNLTIGPQVVSAVNRSTSLFLDVHLMIYNPYDYIERYIEAGADRLTIHFEATESVEETLAYIRKCGIQAGLAFSPETTEEFIPKYLTQCDLILIMSVHPGFGGQAFLKEAAEKIRYTRHMCDQLGVREGGKIAPKNSKEEKPPFLIAVDGGINDVTAKTVVEAGANILISGNYLFNEAESLQIGIERLRASRSAKHGNE